MHVPSPTATGGQAALELITCELDGERFAIEIRWIQEIHRATPTSPIPNLAPGIAGVTNLRSRIVPVVDLKAVLLGSRRPYPERSRLLVAEVDGACLALHVDGTRDVLLVEPERLLELPAGARHPALRLTRAVVLDEAGPVHVLDLYRLFAQLLAGGAS